jgi:acetolactate synthase-1/2/3 large subunit
MKTSDFIADYLSRNGINKIFSVTGGFAMHLNESFSKMDVVYQHGEGPCGYSAMGYSRVMNEPSIVCVTAGCGATNAITPCLVAYQDSVPILFISGAVPSKDNVRYLKHSMRVNSGSDCDIIDMVGNITKYAVEICDQSEVLNSLDNCIYHLKNGIPGPVWLSIPLDIQTTSIGVQIPTIIPEYKQTVYEFPFDLWNKCKRPVIVVGNGIHITKTVGKTLDFITRCKAPVVCSFFGTDIAPGFNIGRVGMIGDRTGNYIIQKSDFILCIGCSLGKSMRGYNELTFAPDAYIERVSDIPKFYDMNIEFGNYTSWLSTCNEFHKMWFRELPNPDNILCPYTFLHKFFTLKPPAQNTVVSSGSIACVAWHQYICKTGDRYIMSGHGDMGYEIPVAIGCAIANGRHTWSIVGDGSFQFNFQELHTIKSMNIPVKILYFNNGGYGAIQITQLKYFKNLTGTEFKSLPDVSKIADTYDIKFFTSCEIEKAIDYNGPCIVEIICNVQERYPRHENKLHSNGTFTNSTFDNMYPFIEDVSDL